MNPFHYPKATYHVQGHKRAGAQLSGRQSLTGLTYRDTDTCRQFSLDCGRKLMTYYTSTRAVALLLSIFILK